MTKSLQAEIPDQLLRRATVLVREGWAADRDEMLTEACAGIWIRAAQSGARSTYASALRGAWVARMSNLVRVLLCDAGPLLHLDAPFPPKYGMSQLAGYIKGEGSIHLAPV